MRTVLKVELELSCGGMQMQVEAELDFMVEVLSHTPAERAGREHAAVPEDWEIEVRLAEPLLIQEVEVWAAGQPYEPTEAQRREILEELRNEI